jgi:hypothetical protein
MSEAQIIRKIEESKLLLVTRHSRWTAMQVDDSSDDMSEHQLIHLLYRKRFADSLAFLNSCDDKRAVVQLVGVPSCMQPQWNALMRVAYYRGVPDELIRAMIKRGGGLKYINITSLYGRTAAMVATIHGSARSLDLLLTLGADPQGCRERAENYNPLRSCRTVLYRFEQRTTLACCLRYYDELHQTSALYLHPDIAALPPFAKILHDLHGINGDMHSLSRMILSFI